MDEPETWRWIWLVATVVFALGEMTTPGSFFLLPFAIGAGVAAILAFAGVVLGIEWLAFVGVSAGVFLALRPLARKLDKQGASEGIGAKRLINQTAVVLEDIPGDHELGMVRVHREEWRAESIDGTPIPAGVTVVVLDQRGTRLVVEPASVPSGAAAEPPREP